MRDSVLERFIKPRKKARSAIADPTVFGGDPLFQRLTTR